MPSPDQTGQIGVSPRIETSVARAASGAGDVPSPTTSAGATQGGWFLFLGLGLLGGIAGGIAVEQTHDFFHPVKLEGVAGNGILSAEQLAQVAVAQVQADYRNALLAMGLLGLAVGACLGLAQRAGRCAVLARLLAGGLSGAVLGAAGGLAAVFVRERLRGWNTLDETGQPDALLVQLHTMAVQLPAWIGIAVAVGLTAGVLARRGALVGRTAGLAIVAVLLASLLYPTLASIFFATQDPGGVIPGGQATRLFWATLHAGLVGLIVGGLGSPAASPAAPSAVEGNL
jgi:hypothetical protein